MSDKGKEKAIEVHDSDSDTEFFRAKPRRTFSKPRPRPPPPPVEATYVSSDSDSQKRPKKRTKPKSTLPAWTRERQTSREPRKERKEEDRPRAPSAGVEVVSLLSDDDEPGPSKPRKSRVALTPPPELDDEEKARIHAMADDMLKAVTVVEDSEPEEVEGNKSSPPPADRGMKVQITVQMIADPEKKAKSERAAKHYEKKRVVTVYEHDKMRKVVEALAQRLEKMPDEIMLVYNNTRLFTLDSTPNQLGIVAAADMEGYEKTTWDKLQEQKRAERARLLNDDTEPSSSQIPEKEDSPPAAEEDEEKLKLVIRGAAGELRFSCLPTTAVCKICSYYCSKFGLSSTNARLDFDGETFAGEATISDMDLESGDMVDIHYD